MMIAVGIWAQAPEKFNYQGIARDAAGSPLTAQAIGLRLSILSGGASGTIEYQETHTVVTNQHGLFTVQLGGGTLVTGSFSTIDWGNAVHFVQIEMDETGGTNYQLMGSTQLLSVPYALHAGSVDNMNVDWSQIQNIPPDIADGDDDSDVLGSLACSSNQIAVWNGTNWVCQDLPNSTAGQGVFETYGSGQITVLATTTTYTLIPGLSTTVNIPANADVYVQTDGGVQCVTSGTAHAIVDIGIHVDGAVSTQGGQRRIVASNTSSIGQMLTNWSIGKAYTNLSAGNHTFEVRVRDGGGTADANVSGTNPLIQGSLIITVINN